MRTIPCCRWLAALLIPGSLFALAACSGGTASVDLPVKPAPAAFLSNLPDGVKGASTTSQINGSAHVQAGSGVTDTPPVAELDSADFDYSYALYAFTPPLNEQVTAITYDLADINAECWLGLANYASNNWEWSKIVSNAGQGTVQFTSPANYSAPDGNTYWVILAARGHSVVIQGFTATHLSTITPMFYNPPAGQGTIDTSGLSPQTVLMPALPSTGGAVAPVVVYTKTENSQTLLTLGYYDGAQWQDLPLFNNRSFSLPQAHWRNTAEEGVVAAYDVTNGQLLDIRVDQWWEIDQETEIPLPAAGIAVPTLLSMDVDPATGYAGVAYALAGDPARVYTNFEDETGWSEPILAGEYAGETVPSLSFKFDRAGGNPWLAFTHGVANYETNLTVDYALEYGRFESGAWTLTDSGREDSPMFVELGFDGSSPQVVFSEVKYKTLTFGLPPIFSYNVDVPLLVNVFTGTYDGSNWGGYTQVFESTLSYDFSFSNMTITLHLNLAPACAWAKAHEASYNRITGDIVFDVDVSTSPPGFTPRDGTLINAVKYAVDDGSGYTESGYFTGAPGMNLSWAQLETQHAAAYVAADSISVDDVLAGRLGTENTLLYWTPGP